LLDIAVARFIELILCPITAFGGELLDIRDYLIVGTDLQVCPDRFENLSLRLCQTRMSDLPKKLSTTLQKNTRSGTSWLCESGSRNLQVAEANLKVCTTTLKTAQ